MGVTETRFVGFILAYGFKNPKVKPRLTPFYWVVKIKALAEVEASAIIGLKLSEIIFDPMKSRFDYALALVGYLKEHGGEFAPIGLMARIHGLPAAYLEKVAQELKRAGWLESRKGPGGGYRIKGDGAPVSVEVLINFYSPIHEFCPVLRVLRR